VGHPPAVRNGLGPYMVRPAPSPGIHELFVLRRQYLTPRAKRQSTTVSRCYAIVVSCRLQRWSVAP